MPRVSSVDPLHAIRPGSDVFIVGYSGASLFGASQSNTRWLSALEDDMQNKHQVLFVQGGGKGTHDAWDSKLVESLRRELGQGYEIHYPRMPHEDDPSYASWQAKLERECETLRDGAILVGHSLGGTIVVKALTEQLSAQKFAAIFLVAAPFVGDGGWSAKDLQFPADLGARLPSGIPIHFFHGLEDEVAPSSHVDLYARAVPQAHVHRLSGRDHQLNGDLSEIAAQISALEAQRPRHP